MDERVLVVDDERSLARLVAGYLGRDGYQVECAFDGPQALAAARARPPDVVVLDLMLPGLDGIEVCRRLRTFSDCYVIMLTARTEEADKLVGLGVGADDYVTKPFSPRELVARVKAMLRRPRAETPADEAPRRFGRLVISPGGRSSPSAVPSSSMPSGARTGSATSTWSMSTSDTCGASSATTRRRRGSSARCAASGTGWAGADGPDLAQPGRTAVYRAGAGGPRRRGHPRRGRDRRRAVDLPRPPGRVRPLRADLGHEMRTPLSTIEGYLDAAEDGISVPDEDTTTVLRTQTARLRRLAEDLTAVTNAAEHRLHRGPVAPADV